MSSAVIRQAEERDAEAMMDLIRELADFEHGLHLVTVKVEDLIRDGFGDNAMFECLVAESEGRIFGMALYFYTYSTWNGPCLYLEDLIVTRKVRSKGIGTALMNEIIRIGQDKDVSRISWQVLDWNLDAQDFYRKFGASMDGEWLNGRLDRQQIRNFKIDEGI